MKKNPAIFLLPVFILAYLYAKYYLKITGGLEIMMLGAVAMCVIFSVGAFFQRRR